MVDDACRTVSADPPRHRLSRHGPDMADPARTTRSCMTPCPQTVAYDRYTGDPFHTKPRAFPSRGCLEGRILKERVRGGGPRPPAAAAPLERLRAAHSVGRGGASGPHPDRP